MQRRTFFKTVFGGLGAAVAPSALAVRHRRTLIQESPIAGFQFYSGTAVWPRLDIGQVVDLVREPWNIHDGDAVAVFYGGAQIGYVPRAENRAVAQLLDRGDKLEARITRLMVAEDPWQRIRIAISLA